MEDGFGSVRDLYEKAKKVDVGDMVSKWMRSQPKKQTRNYKNYNSYTAPFPKYEFQIDLMDVTSLLKDVGNEIKDQPRYGLLCIDKFSKRTETGSQWSERKYKVILVGRDMMNNRYYYKLDGMSKKYNRHELLLVD